jgi:hypothetical protein
LCPSARSMAATVEESTPPDMATAMVRSVGIKFNLYPKFRRSTTGDGENTSARNA